MPRPRLLELHLTVLVDDYSGMTRLLAEHGLSIHVKAVYDNGETYRLLFDTGQTGEVLLRNAQALKMLLEDIDAVVLSHRHYDHAGGLPQILDKIKAKPLVAHPDVVKPSYSSREGFMRFNLALTSTQWEKIIASLEPVLTRKPLELAPDIWFLGEIPRTSDNSYATRGFYTQEAGEVVPDKLLDDTGIAIKLQDTAIVIAGCSHSGIANIARQAKQLTGAQQIAIIGGLHTGQATDQELETITRELASLNTTEVHAGHCTGLRGEIALQNQWKQSMHRIHSGYTSIFKLPGREE
uniref:MBL fold metallo-hydrolase n=1 Tax=Thermofilum adornatum TaxID=1365176 RepID=A0A7C1CER4_9CREN